MRAIETLLNALGESMIIYRYLSRQLLASTLAVTTVLVFILVSGRFIKYLSEAAAGKIAKEVLLALMLFRLPGFLEMILPLGLFLAILLAYGRLYLENEMTVLAACGYGPRELFKHTALPTIGMATAVGLMSLWLSPWGAQHAKQLISDQRARSSFETLTPGRFHSTRDRRQVTYAERLSEDGKRMENIITIQEGAAGYTVVVAESGWRTVDPGTGVQYLMLEQGHQYRGIPGRADLTVVEFEGYQLKISDPDVSRAKQEIRMLSTPALMGHSSANAWAELQWRVSLPLLVPILVAIALPLSRVNPRQGRFIKMLPGILLYLLYLTLLTSGRSALEDGEDVPAWVGLWWVHAFFAGVALVLNKWPQWRQSMRRQGIEKRGAVCA